jgi:hypothetical protein
MYHFYISFSSEEFGLVMGAYAGNQDSVRYWMENQLLGVSGLFWTIGIACILGGFGFGGRNVGKQVVGLEMTP